MTYLFESLEPRMLLSGSPGDVLTKPIRQSLLDNLSLSASLEASLQSKLDANNLAGFDQQLLDYMRTRTTGKFFFNPADAPTYATFITTNIGDGGATALANKLLVHLFPAGNESQDYTVQLPAMIDWDDKSVSTSPDFIHTLNGQSYWMNLSQAFRFTGNTNYINELISQLASWSGQFATVGEPATFSDTDKRAWLLDSSIRVEAWLWSYFQVLSAPSWTKEANSLLLYKLDQQAQYLASSPTYGAADNRTTSHAKSLLAVTQAFPEFVGASTWETQARTLLFSALDGQFYDDGSHVEQSPGYASGVSEDFLEAKLLDQKNGDVWPAARSDKLTDAIEAYYQFLSPNGKRPAIGDTYRNSSATLFLKSNLIQGVTTFPAAKPRGRDVWLFSPTTVTPFLGNPSNPPLGNRPKTFALPDSGNYIARSGSDTNARQIIFDAGPRGGQHGHFDLLNFELFGYGAPLISDPGLLRYDSSADRIWAQSTPAHNTISIDGVNTGALEGKDNGGIIVDEWEAQSDHIQVTAHHHGYAGLAGRPVVGRSLWYDLDGTILLVDWGEAVESHTFRTSFLLPGTNTSRDLTNGIIRTNNAGGNVKIQTLLRPGQLSTYRTSNIFTSSNPPPNEKDPATQFFSYQSGTFVCFVTLISAYSGATPPNVSAQLLNTPTAGQAVNVRLTKNGTPQDISFATPVVTRLNSRATNTGSYCDLAFDSAGRLHLAYFDRTTKNLKYTVRSTNGKWSIVETIDSEFECGSNPSMAIDGNGRVGVAYTNANHGDLKYASFNGSEWRIETVDSRGSTGHYPSLAFSRRNGPVITYYDKSRGDLRMASSATNGWDLITIDSGSIGTKDVGRFSHLVLDPTRPEASKWAIAYEDTGGGRYRYAIQGNLLNGEQMNGYTFFNIDTTTTRLGGYTYLAFDPLNRPCVSFYDSADSALKYARSSGDTFTGINFTSKFVTTKPAIGYYSNLYFDSQGKANIFYFNRSNNLAMRARNTSGDIWAFSELAPGGREIHVARFGSTVAYTNLNEAIPALEVLF